LTAAAACGHLPARWHTRGHRVVYAAPNPATALLEVLVHAEINIHDLPLSFRFLEISVPDEIATETVDGQQMKGWWQTPLEETQRVGDEWLDSARTALLLVPCVIVPDTYNVLFNPLHPDSARIEISRVHRHPLDQRLVARAPGR
jgi:RES domain-containing protein